MEERCLFSKWEMRKYDGAEDRINDSGYAVTLRHQYNMHLGSPHLLHDVQDAVMARTSTANDPL